MVEKESNISFAYIHIFNFLSTTINHILFSSSFYFTKVVKWICKERILNKYILFKIDE